MHSGGGVAGLTAAIALTHFTKESKDIKIEVYEAAAKFTEIGAAFGFWPRPWKILKKLGLTDSLEKLLEKPPIEEFPLRRSRIIVWHRPERNFLSWQRTPSSSGNQTFRVESHSTT